MTSKSISRLAPLSLVALAVVALPSCNKQDSSILTNPNGDNVTSEAAPKKLVDIDFNKHVRPILSDRCFSCHGPDAAAVAKNAGLRLDSLEAATTVTKNGHTPITPGNPDESYIFNRILDPNSPMPPLDSDHKQLTPDEVEILKRWVADGAEYTPHWAFTQPEAPAVPETENAEWASNEIDQFILKHLESVKVAPSPETDRATLLRRLSFVLTGLAPTLDELSQFINDESADAYEKEVDRLLASPRFGERMGSLWLDAARYADTHGYHHDEYRSIWPYRDYVVKAFNENMPYDQFVTEQLAGDLIENASQDQLIASAFNRNHNINDEGGALDLEYRVEAISDRVETTGTVFLGLTMNCCRCHDHKYDPIEQQDYYNLYSFFNSFQEKGRYQHSRHGSRAYPPYLELPTPEQESQRAELTKQLAEANQLLKEAAADQKKARQDAVNKLNGKLGELNNQILRTMVSKELPDPVQGFVLDRGAYDAPLKDRPTERKPIKFLGGELPKGAPANRLGLAQWITSPENPLTSRVHVNRLWSTAFGTGILSSQGDFGNQSPFPVYQDLLDYLAIEFVKSGWDQKALLKSLVMSSTFKQSAKYRAELKDVDPNNEWLSYYPRRRLPAEMLRDHALASSGLLNDKMGGPPVKPYQPVGLWAERAIPSSGTKNYKRDDGDALYRRTLYTFIKRTAAPPMMANFDAPSREACTVSRSTTNTPLQALQLWNDEQFLEISRVLAADLLTQTISDEQRLAVAFHRCTSRQPDEGEMKILLETITEFRKRYAEKPEQAKIFLKQGVSPIPEGVDPSELAAWALTMSAILNLDETISIN